VENAVPSWKDKLDWDKPEDEVETQAGGDEPKATEAEAPKRPALSLSNAVPTWKDQLDWSSPEEAGEPALVSTGENEVLETAESAREVGESTGENLATIDVEQEDEESAEADQPHLSRREKKKRAKEKRKKRK
jgi:hypothetical protein